MQIMKRNLQRSSDDPSMPLKFFLPCALTLREEVSTELYLISDKNTEYFDIVSQFFNALNLVLSNQKGKSIV